MREKNEHSLLSPPLKPILPSQNDRFTPPCVQDTTARDDTIIRPQARAQFCSTDSDRSDQLPILEKAVHPEGGIVYVYKNLVSDRPISARLRSIGDEISSQCCKLNLSDITVFLRRQASALEYYVAAHSDETVVWLDNQSPDSLRSVNTQRAKNMLSEEYWAHMEAIPGSRHVSSHSVSQLKSVLSSLAIDSATSDGSTSPFTYEQIQDFLQLLNSFSGNHIDEYQTYAVARIWNMVWHARVINNFGSSDACLDRFTALSSNPPIFTASNRIFALAMLGAADRNLTRCSRAWAGRVAYVGEWRQFKMKNEAEWQQAIKLASMVAIASLMLPGESKSKLSTLLSTILSLSAVASGHHLVTESQNIGDHAADASAYFQKWEKPDYSVQRIALRNAVPQALLGWAFIVLVGSVTRVI